MLLVKASGSGEKTALFAMMQAYDKLGLNLHTHTAFIPPMLYVIVPNVQDLS